MKLLLITTFVATICYVNAGKTQRLLAAMLANGNGGLLAGNGGLIAGNGGLLAGMNGGLLAGMNGGLANGAIPGIMAGGLNPPVLAGGGAGFFRQPQFAQFVPGLPAYALPAPFPNVYPVPAVNGIPVFGVPQMQPMNPPQQAQMGIPGGAMQQQPQLQVDPLGRFRRHIMKQDGTAKTTVDTQIPVPTETMKPTPCNEEARYTDK